MSTVRYCPQCHSEVSPTARFCAECGSSMTPNVPLSSGTVSGSYSSTVTEKAEDSKIIDDKSTKIIIGVLSSAVVLLLIAVGVLASEIQKVKNRPTTEAVINTPAQVQIQPPVNPTPVTQPPAATTTPVVTETQPPADVVEYLKSLQGIDQKRIALLAKVPTPATTPPPTPSPDSNGTGSGTPPTGTPETTPAAPSTTPTTGPSDIDNDWKHLIDEFRSNTVPDTCRLLAANYLTYLNDCRSEVAKNNGTAPSSSNDLTSDALKAEVELVKVCTTTKAPRLFTIAYPGTSQENRSE